jgi:hypothetical protein
MLGVGQPVQGIQISTLGRFLTALPGSDLLLKLAHLLTQRGVLLLDLGDAPFRPVERQDQQRQRAQQ